MLTGIKAYTPRGATLELPLGPSPLGFIVRDIDGLGPVKASFVTSSLASAPGLYFRSSTREARNVVLKIGFDLGLLSGGSANARKELGKFFSPGVEVELEILTDTGVLGRIKGRTETHEPDIFTQDPSVTISILCFEPDIVALNAISNTWASDVSTIRTFNNPGDIDSGFEFQATITTATTWVSLALNGYTMDFTQSLAVNDVLRITTHPKQKTITRTRSGVTTSVLAGVSAASKWPLVIEGSNQIKVSTQAGWFNYTFSYKPRYGGA